jgi:hypothetical protein
MAGPSLLLAYGCARLVDGLDGAHGPGPAWTVGHGFFLVGLILFGVLMFGLRRLVPGSATPRRLLAAIACGLGALGIAAFVRVVVLDLAIGSRATDHADMARVSARIGNFPGVPEEVDDLGPMLFMVGLLTLLIQLALLRPRRLPWWSPVLAAAAFLAVTADLDLLPLAGLLFLVALTPLVSRQPSSLPGAPRIGTSGNHLTSPE